MLDLNSITNVLNACSILVIFISNIVLLYYKNSYLEIIGFCYILWLLIPIIYVNTMKEIIKTNVLFKNSGYFLNAFLFFNTSILLIILNTATLGPGLYLIFIAIFNILMGTFNEPPREILLENGDQ